MPQVTFVNEKKTIEVPAGSNLRSEALKNGVDLYPGIYKVVNCRGLGLCCSCRVHVKQGAENVSRRGWWEWLHTMTNPVGFFSRIGHEDEMRLSCQMRVNGDCSVETKPELPLHGENFFS